MQNGVSKGIFKSYTSPIATLHELVLKTIIYLQVDIQIFKVHFSIHFPLELQTVFNKPN